MRIQSPEMRLDIYTAANSTAVTRTATPNAVKTTSGSVFVCLTGVMSAISLPAALRAHADLMAEWEKWTFPQSTLARVAPKVNIAMMKNTRANT